MLTVKIHSYFSVTCLQKVYISKMYVKEEEKKIRKNISKIK